MTWLQVRVNCTQWSSKKRITRKQCTFFFLGGDAEKGRDFVSFLFSNLSSEKGHTGNENCFIQPFVLW